MVRKSETMTDEKRDLMADTENRGGEPGEHAPPSAGDPEKESTPSDDKEAALTAEEASEPEPEMGAMEEGLAPEEGLGREVQVLQEDLGRLRDQHLRLAADFENYRKRVSSELATGWVRAQAELAGALLDGLDDLQRVSQFTTEDATLEALIEGVDLVERKFMKALTDAGLKALDPSGRAFDPNTMEAVMRVPTEEEGRDETVHQVFQKGYLFKDLLVRPARVSVYKDDD
jgi:molecular chaperone GrpE